MPESTSPIQRWSKSRILVWVRSFAMAAVGLGLLVVVLYALAGGFHHKAPPGRITVAPPPLPAEAPLFTVDARPAPRVVAAIGAVEARRQTSVASRLLARVRRVAVSAGQPVDAGDVLVELDPTDVEARIRAAEAEVEAARSQLEQAESDFEQIRGLAEQEAAPPRELADARRRVERLRAEMAARQEALAEVVTQRDDATIRSPFDGVVIDEMVDPGDLATPGMPLVVLYDPTQLQLAASVPERVAVFMKMGDPVMIRIDALNLTLPATISEIVPQAAPASRALTVKADAEFPPTVISGMFGRLLIPDGEAPRISVPAEAVARVGQLSYVVVVDESRTPSRRYVRPGRPVDDGRVEILAGLTPGETIAARFPTDADPSPQAPPVPDAGPDEEAAS